MRTRSPVGTFKFGSTLISKPGTRSFLATALVGFMDPLNNPHQVLLLINSGWEVSLISADYTEVKKGKLEYAYLIYFLIQLLSMCNDAFQGLLIVF